MTRLSLRRLSLAFAASLLALSATVAEAGIETVDTSGSLSGNYLAGRSASKNRDMDIAAQYFAEALREDPSNPLLIERAFILDLSAGNMPSAEDRARAVISFDSQHRLARTVLGLREFCLKHYAKARDNFRKAQFTPVGELSSGLLTAWSFAAEKNQRQALAALDILDRNDAFASFKTFHAALISDVLGDKLRADEFYRKSYDQSGNSLRVVEAYGSWLARNGRKDEARQVYERFLANGDENVLVKEALRQLAANQAIAPLIATAADGAAESLFSIASALTDEQSIDVSLVYAQMALAAKPGFLVAQTLLGDIYEDTERFDKAIEAYEAVPKDSVVRPNADIQIAVDLDRIKRSDEAIARLDALIAADAANYDARVTKGNILRAAEKFADAADAYSSALALVPQPQRRHWSVFYFRGICYERAKDWTRAEADFRKALELSPEQPMVLNYLGYSLIDRREDLDNAMAMVRKAVELKPNDGYIVDSLGWAHYQLGEYDEAVRQLERAVELKPEDPTINDHLGDAYWRAGRKLEARFQWQHAKDAKPDDEMRAAIEKKLSDGLPDLPAPAAPGASQADAPKSVN